MVLACTPKQTISRHLAVEQNDGECVNNLRDMSTVNRNFVGIIKRVDVTPLLVPFSIGRAAWKQMHQVMLRKQQHDPKGESQSETFVIIFINRALSADSTRI